MHSDHSLGSFILKHLSIVHQAGVMLIRGSPPAIAVDLTPRSLAPRPIRGLRTGVKLRRILFVRCKQRVADASCVRAAAAKRLRLRCRDNPLQTLPQQADVMCRVLLTLGIRPYAQCHLTVDGEHNRLGGGRTSF